MDNRYARSIAIFGEEGQLKLNNSRVAVFGLGGVGSYAVESLARSGVGKITLIDNDEYSTSNLNRQLFATEKTVGKLKTEVAKQRILEINSKIEVTLYNAFILDSENDGIDFTKFDYVIDAIDTVSGKLSIIKRANKASVPVISCMSAGNKLDATLFKVDDIFARDKTSLDIFWIKDKSLADLDNLPDPDVLASDIIDNLQSAIDSFNALMGTLNK